MQFSLFPTAVHLTKVKPADKMYRFYHLIVLKDLFGNGVLLREWGRIGSGGTVRAELFGCETEAGEKLEKIAAEKQRRGYDLRSVL